MKPTIHDIDNASGTMRGLGHVLQYDALVPRIDVRDALRATMHATTDPAMYGYGLLQWEPTNIRLYRAIHAAMDNRTVP